MIKIYVDGGTRGEVICLVDSNKKTTITKKRTGKLTNNELEYLALIYGLEYCDSKYRNENVTIYMDSQLVVKQMKGEYRITTERLAPLHEKAKSKMREGVNIVWVPRSKNLAGIYLEDSY